MPRSSARFLVTLALAASVAGCAPAPEPAARPEPEPAPPMAEESPTTTPPAEEPAASQIAWLDTELTDAVTGKSFRLSDYRGQTVLLHSFAVW